MRKFYLSSVLRCTDIERANHGALYVVDYDTKKEVSKRFINPLPFCANIDNPRGGVRGWRGITSYEMEGNYYIVVANNDSLVFFDSLLKVVYQVVTHPVLSNIHDIVTYNGKIYIASTGTESLVVFDPTVGFEVIPILDSDFIWSKVGPYVETIGRKRFVPDESVDYRFGFREDVLHFNSFTIKDNYVYGYFNTLAMLVKFYLYDLDDFEILIAPEMDRIPQGGSLNNPHNTVFISDRELLVNNSSHSSLAVIDVDTRKVRTIYTEPEKESGVDEIKYGWLRGMCYNNGVAYVGCGGSTVIGIDVSTGEEVYRVCLADEIPESPFAIFFNETDFS